MSSEATLCLLDAHFKDLASAEAQVARLPYWFRLNLNEGGKEAYGDGQVAVYYRADPYVRSESIAQIATQVVQEDLTSALAARNITPFSYVAATLRLESLILLVETDRRVFAYCTGMGSLSLPFDLIVAEFGLRAALKTVSHDRLIELATKSPGTRGSSRDEKLNKPGRAHRFVLSSYYSSLRRVVGEVSRGNKLVRLHAADGIRVQWPMTFGEAQSRARYWMGRYVSNQPLPPELIDLCSVRQISSEADRMLLTKKLHREIVSGNVSDLAIVPWFVDGDDEGKYAFHYRKDITKADYEEIRVHTTEAATWKQHIRNTLTDWEDFRWAKVSRDGEKASDARPLYEWISATLEDSAGVKTVCDGGRWYEIQGQFLERLEADCKRIIDRFQFPHPEYTFALGNGVNEFHLNEDLCLKYGYTLLDEAKYRKKVGGSFVELCDVFDSQGNLYVVKRMNSMDSVVKAVSQALDAAEAVRSDDGYWKSLVSEAKLVPYRDLKDDPDKWRFVLLLVGPDKRPLLDQLTFKGRLELRRFRDQIRTYGHDYAVAQIVTA